MRPGDVIGGRFEIERLASAGGMGEIYRARDRRDDRLVAVKIVLCSDRHLDSRFEREAAVLAELRHPHIVSYLAHGLVDDGVRFLAMEWLEGEDLAKHLQASELTRAQSLALAARVASALAAAHARGIVHRDIKPSNLFLEGWQPDQVKVIDFGVARLAGMPALTATGDIVGTPGYMAPEQARGARDLDARVDVFALGLVLYRCLTGRPALSGNRIADLVAQLTSSTPLPRAGDSAELDSLLGRMLAKDPAARPRDGAAVLAELEAIGGLDAATSAQLDPARFVVPGQLAPGERVDRYRLEAFVGRGAAGSVYRAFDERLERRVALKLMPAGEDSSAEGRFLREARAAAGLVHRHVVVVHDAGRAGPWLYVAMELVEGSTLRAASRTPGVGYPRLVRWLCEVARALEAAHALGLTHGDVKPDNVMIAADGTARVVDFGLARRPVSGDDETHDGRVRGTPAYLSPEHLRGEPTGPASDQFAWAVTAYEVLAGELPWTAGSPAAVVAQILEQPAPSLSTRAPELPPEVAAIVQRALSRRPEERFAGMAEVAAALQPFGEAGERTAARPRRRRAWLGVGALAGAALLGTAVVMARAREPAPAAAPPVVVAGSSEAARLHEQGMRLWRSHSLVQATDAWTRAVELDPELAPAQLRLALEGIAQQSDTAVARQRYQAAGAASRRLDAREQALHAASAPMFGVTRDGAAWRAALDELLLRYPRDGELLYWRAHAELAAGLPREALRTARAAIEADPDFLPAYTLEWSTASDLGEDYLPLLRACARRFPRSGSCAGALVWEAMAGSDCEQLDRLAAEYDAAVPDHFIGARGRALAFHARGAAREAVEELLRHAVARMSSGARRSYGTLIAELAIAHGDLATGERALRRDLDELGGVADAGPRALPVAQLADLLSEEGRDDEARAEVVDFLRREEALAEPSMGSTFQTVDGRADVLAVAARLGVVAGDELDRRRTQVLASQAIPANQAEMRALLARTPAEGAEAAAAPPHRRAGGRARYLRARALALAGRRDEAIAGLRDALGRCDGLTWALEVPRARQLLGQLLEEAGDADGARAAYRAVIEVWGTARPFSVTAAEARRRLRLLR